MAYDEEGRQSAAKIRSLSLWAPLGLHILYLMTSCWTWYLPPELMAAVVGLATGIMYSRDGNRD